MARRNRGSTGSQPEDPCWRVALYIRLSREDGNDVSVSVANQRAQLQSFLAEFDEPYELVDEYIDDGYSGTDSHRQAFQRMLEDIRSRRVNCVIVRDPSRLSRNYWEAGMYMEQLFVECDVRFISLSLPPLDSYRHPEAMNSLALPIQNVINDDFCRQTSQKIRSVFHVKRSRGEFIGAFAPYGYRKDEEDKSRLCIDPPAARVVRDIFLWFVYEGLSKRGITMRLNALGIANPSRYKQQNGLNYQCRRKDNDGLWSNRTVSFILANEVYLGHMVQGRQRMKSYKVHEAINVAKEEWYVVKHTHEAIIDEATFAMAQELGQKDTRTAPRQQQLHLFAGFLKCADCGKGMRRCKGKNHVYYNCRTHREKSLRSCTRHSIREDKLAQALLLILQVHMALFVNVFQLSAQIDQEADADSSDDPWKAALRRKQRELNKVTTANDALYIDWKSGELDEENYHRMKNSFAQTEARLRSEMEKLQEELAQRNAKDDNSMWEEICKHGMITALSRSLLVCMIAQIKVHEQQHITVVFNYADPFIKHNE